MSKRWILVTGASGFIGSHLAQGLLKEGKAVRCQYRRAVKSQNLIDLEKAGAQIIRKDLAPYPSGDVNLAPLMQDVETVFHLAALTSDWGSQSSFERANVCATRSLLDAAEIAGVSRFVDVSSLSVHGFGLHRSSTENGPYYPPTHFYQETKRRAEDLALSRHRDGFGVSVIRPGNVYGPNDTTMMFPMFKAIEKGRMGTVGGGRSLTPPIYISDMVDALIAAGSMPQALGERINVTGGEWITWRQFMDIAADSLGVKRPKMNLPAWIAMPVAQVLNSLWKLFGVATPPPITPYRIKHVMYDFHFDISKAKSLLHYQPKVNCVQGLQRAAESYKLWDK